MTTLLFGPVVARFTVFGHSFQAFQSKGERRIVAIARRASTEPTELFLSLSMILSAWILLTRKSPGALVFPSFFGRALLMLGVFGLVGLMGRSSALRSAFSFGGVVLGAWMGALYCWRDWHDPAWAAFAMGTMACAWVFVRMVCDVTARRIRRMRFRALGKGTGE